jgi:membrane-associated phospholipid phosphatase
VGAIETGWGLDVVLWFQSWRTPLIELVSRLLDLAGSQVFYTLLFPLIYWCVDARLGRQLGPLVMFTAWANAWLKEWWARPRPFQVSDAVANVVDPIGYGAPSGHTQLTVVLWGGISLRVRRGWFYALAALYIVAMGLSRIALGVHFPQDVALGLLLGLATLALFAWGEPSLNVWLKRLGVWEQIGLVAAATGLMLLVHPALVPASSAETMALAVTPIGVFLGLEIGYVLETRSLHFSVEGVWLRRVLRYLVGMVGVLIVQIGLGLLFEGLEPALAFRLIRYGLIGFWAAYGAPWVFVKTGLARTADDG